MIAPTENLLEYKIVERNMAHLFYLGKYYLALLVYLHKARNVAVTNFCGEKKKSEQTLFFKKFIAP